MLKVTCGECQFWAKGVKFRKTLELCSLKGVYMPKSGSCDKAGHVDPTVRRLLDDFSR